MNNRPSAEKLTRRRNQWNSRVAKSAKYMRPFKDYTEWAENHDRRTEYTERCNSRPDWFQRLF